MATKNKTSQNKRIVLILTAVVLVIVAILIYTVSQNSTAENTDSTDSDNSTYSQEVPEESTTNTTPDTSSPTYDYDRVQDGMSESEVDSIFDGYKKNVSTEITFEGEHSKTVTYTGDLPEDSFIVVTIRFTDGVVSYKTNYTGENPKKTPYDSITTGMSESEVDKLLSDYHKYEESSSAYGGQASKIIRYTDSGSTFLITYLNGIVSAKTR